MLDKQKAITVKNVGHIISSGMEEKWSESCGHVMFTADRF